MHRIRQCRIFRLGRKSSRPADPETGIEATTEATERTESNGYGHQRHHPSGDREWPARISVLLRALCGSMQPGHCFGARNETSGLALRVRPQTRPQTTSEVTAAVALGLGWQQTARLRRRIAPQLDFGIDCQVPVGFAWQTGYGTKVKFAFRLPFRVTVETAPGTVPGTVPGVIRGMSILATSTALNASSIRCLARSWFTQPHRLPSNAWPVGLRAPKVASLGVHD
jgi:hypothetical protein